MEQQHGKYIIRYSKANKRFEAYDGDNMVSYSQDLETLENKLDKEAKTKYPRVSVYNNRWDGWEKCEITSLADDTSRDKEFWVVNKNKKREKCSGRYLFTDNSHNKELIDKILANSKECERLNELGREMETQLQKFDAKNYKPIEVE